MRTPPDLRLPPTARTRRIRTHRGELAAIEVPGVEPLGAPVLLVPGFTGSKEDFIPLLEPIAARGHRVVALDQLGQYESSAAAGPGRYGVTALGADLLAVVDALGAGPVHLLGHSFGGLVVRAAALADAGRLASLTLLCSGPAAIPAGTAADLRLLVDALGVMTIEAVWTGMRHLEAERGEPEPAPEVAEFLQRRFLATDPVQLCESATALLTATDQVEELAAALEAAGRRALVVTGEDDDRWPLAQQAQMARRLHVDHVVIPAAGHSPNVDNPEETARALTEFWAAAA